MKVSKILEHLRFGAFLGVTHQFALYRIHRVRHAEISPTRRFFHQPCLLEQGS